MNFKSFLEIAKVTDLTDPKTPFRDKWNSENKTHIKGAGEPHDYFVVLGANETLFYRWGDGNVMPWKQVLNKAHEVAATGSLKQDINQIMITINGNVIIDPSRDNTKWPGVMNLYSKEPALITQELLNRRVIHSWAKIFLGNWASKAGQDIGTAQDVVGRQSLPDPIVLYHGTNTDRWQEIQEQGIKPVPVHARMWKGRADRGHPEYRDDAVYLTASPLQAAQYGRRAINVARKHGVKGTESVILQIEIPKRDWVHFRPDDDYLQKMGEKASSHDWYSSLNYFGQVAYVGSIDPSQIKLLRQAKKADAWNVEKSVQ